MDTDVTSRSGPIDTVLVCVPEILRFGIARLLATATGVTVRQRASVSPPLTNLAAVAVLGERNLGDLITACTAARASLAREVVVVLQHPDVHLMLDCVAAGAIGFVVERDSAVRLTAAVRAVGAGDPYVSSELLGVLLAYHRANRPKRSEQDRRLLRLLAGGRATSEIAELLGVAPKTVRNRSSLLYRELGVRSRSAAIETAERRGLLD